MIRICPSCGYRTADDQSLFCNKCGYPFPKEEPKPAPVMTRTAPARAPAPPAYPSGGEPRPARPSGKQPRQQSIRGGRVPPFKRFIARNHIRQIYWLGAITIILVFLLEISAGFSTPETDVANMSFTNTTALVANPPASPLFWIGFLIAGSLVWRVFCELVAAVFRIYDTLSEGGAALPEGGAAGYGEEWAEGMVECPRCGKVVPADQVRECEHCGVQGCSTCIRMMGLLKKTMTCKNCFENK
jgi:hypothetical protein